MSLSIRLSLLLLLNACYLAQYPVTPKVAEQAVFRVTWDEGYGTGWAVDKHHLVTAGHVCEEQSVAYVVWGHLRRFPATVVIWEKGGGLNDLCILHTEVALDSWLVLADQMPAVGDKVAYTGYPAGEFDTYPGIYLGDLDGKEEHWNDYTISAPSAPGASGSPVYTPEGVIGVLVRRRTDGGVLHDGSDGAAIISLDKLKDILDSVGVKYDRPPTVPEDPWTHESLP